MINLKEKKETKTKELTGKFYQENVSNMERIIGIGEPLEEGDYFQQGDCLIIQLGDDNFVNSPKEITGKKVDTNLVLKGQQNSHALYEGDFDIYMDGEQVFIDVKTFTILDHVKDENAREHAEHHAQYIPKGKYYVGAILEFDHLEKIARQVID
jgi:hypothetical protein